MTEYIILFLIIYGWTAFFQITERRRNPYEFVATCSSIIILLYLFALFQCLQYGLYVVAILGVAGIIFSLKKITISSENRFDAFQRAVILAIIFCIAFMASWGLDYSAWDEFSHWGTQVEYLMISKNLHTDSKLLLFPEYIPGLSLWRYFGRVALRHVGPSASYFINYVLIFSCVYALAYSNSILKSILKCCIIFLGLLIFFQSLVGALYADPIQSILILTAFRIASEEDSINFIYLLLVTAVIVLFKHVGLIFALLIGCYYASIQIYAFKNQKLKILFKTSSIIILSILLYLSWSMYLRYYALNKNAIDISSLMNGDVFDFIKIMKNHLIGVLSNQFPHANYSGPTIDTVIMSQGISLLIFWLIILLLGGAIIIFMPVKNGKIYLINYIFLITASIGYLLFLAFIRVATLGLTGDVFSFTRYFVVLLFPSLFIIILFAWELSLSRICFIGAIIVSIYLVAAPSVNTIFVQKKRVELEITTEFKTKANLVKKYASLNSVIWYINSELSPAYFIFRMRILPLEVKSYWNGFGLYLNDILKTADDQGKRVEKFSSMLCDVDLIYVDIVPENFWIQYADLFDKTKGHVYKIKRGFNDHCVAVILE